MKIKATVKETGEAVNVHGNVSGGYLSTSQNQIRRNLLTSKSISIYGIL